MTNFSFLDHPEETFDLLAKMAAAEAHCLQARIDFEDPRILDIGPYVVWGMMKRHMAPFMSGGTIRSTIGKVLKLVDLDRYMGITVRGSDDTANVWSFPLEERSPGEATSDDLISSAPRFAKVADKLVDAVNDWLGAIDVPMELNEGGMAQLNNMATEILNNAERHSRTDGDGGWVVTGFMERSRKERSSDSSSDAFRYVCHLAFMNTGITIAESISNSRDPAVLEVLGRYCHTHPKIAPECLHVVVALQDGVSRLSQKGGESLGGVGMMDIVNLAAELGETDDGESKHIVAIISGHACIRFYGRFAHGELRAGRRVQWFNTEKSLEAEPDSHYVTRLKHRFPGTIITMRFCLDGKMLEKKLREDNAD